MELPEGMMAVVRAMPDATLAMSVLDGNRQYTLIPNNNNNNNGAASTAPAATATYVPVVPVVPVHNVGTDPSSEGRHALHNHAAQAVDGRYASVYQMTHCHVQPTSPPVQLTEFPPQRAELSRGQGNFEVGGIGSGETSNSPIRTSVSYRGGMNWPDRSVYSPRNLYHHEPDLFADSLRKYPSMSAERSAEIVERLINYNHMKNSCSKSLARGFTSPPRCEASASQCLDRRSCISASMRTAKNYEPDVCVKTKVTDESPTRDTCKKMDYEAMELKRSIFGRNYDVRYLREITRRPKEMMINVSTYPYSHPVCPVIKERYDHLPPKNNVLSEINSINSVDTETQGEPWHRNTKEWKRDRVCSWTTKQFYAEIPMASKEVTTVPREQPSTRNVAVPLSPSSSHSSKPSTHQVQSSTSPEPPEIKLSNKSIQTTNLTELPVKPRKSVQTCISSIDIANKKKVKTCRKTKSQEELSTNNELEEELLQIAKDLSVRSDVDARFSIRNGLLRKLRRIYRTDRNDRLKIKLGRCVRDQLYSHVDFKSFTRELSNELISKIQASNMFLRCYGSSKVLRTEGFPASNNEGKYVNGLIKEWLDDVPIKQVDYLGRPVNKELVLQAVATKIKYLIMNKVHHDRSGSLKPELLDTLEDIPIEVKQNKNCFLNRLASDITRKIKDILTYNTTERRKWQKALDLDKSLRNNAKKENFAYTYILPTDIEVKQFVKQELTDFTTKFQMTICSSTEREIQVELVDILTDSLSKLRYGDDEKVKKEILIMLSEFIKLSESEGKYFANNLIYNFKDLLKRLHTEGIAPKTFVVLQNPVQNSSNQTIDSHNIQTTHHDINRNLNLYTQQVVEQIIEWLESLQGLSSLDLEVKKIVAQDLAGDILDRQKYLELNPNNKKSDSDELEHLKYQIYKRINKLVAEDNLETIENASELMQRIHNVRKSLTKPAFTVMNVEVTCNSCCNKDSIQSQNQNRSVQGASRTQPDTKFDQGRQSSQYAFCLSKRSQPIPTQPKPTKCCSAEVDTKNLGVMTDTNQGEIRAENTRNPADSPPWPGKKNVFTETDMPRIPVTCPRGTSVGTLECPREQSRNTRFSEPGPSSRMNNQIPPRQNMNQPYSVNSQSLGGSAPLCCVIEPKDPTSAIKQLNDEYDHYLQNWVSQIPIITSDPEELKVIDKMRKGIYNGVWKARAKLQLNPDAMADKYYYQDLLDDELEDLLNLLPESSDLTKNKQMLKNQLIEKTIGNNEEIQTASAAPSYKQQLMDSIGSHIPRKRVGFTSSDVAKICEDIHKLNLAETFILYTMYREKDGVKAKVYKKKLMKQVQEFFDNLKRTHGIEAKDMDFKTYKDEIIDALHTVPQPSDDTIREEGNEVLIGLDIEQWFSDLPLYPTDNNFEKLCRKRYRDTLTKKVHDLEKQKKLANCEDELRHEITKFMTKLPLREGEEQNVPFMVEELINRLKNRPPDLVEGSAKRRFVPLIDPLDYDEFSRDMQQCSSFANTRGARRAQINESSYFVRDGERIDDPCCALTGQFNNVNIRGENLDTNQELVSYNNDNGQSRQRYENQDFDQWESLNADDEPPPPVLFEQAPNQLPDYCQGQNVPQGNVIHQSIPRDGTYREPENIMRDGSYRPGHTSRIHDHPIGTCLRQTMSPSRRSPEPVPQTGPSCRFIQNQLPEAGVDETICPNQRYFRQAQDPNLFLSRLGQTHLSRTCPGQSPPLDRNSPGPSGIISGNINPRGFPGLPPEEFDNCSNICPRATESRMPMGQNPNRLPLPIFVPEASDRPYDILRPGTSQGQFSSRQSPSCFSKQPVGSSTPQPGGPPPRISRPKKRTLPVDRSRRDAAKKKLEMTDTDDSGSEEVKCRCMERFWKCRKKRSFTPCEDCEIEFPPCFPLRFSYPYYF